MGGGNVSHLAPARIPLSDPQGAKAAHKREINAKDAKKAGSQLKTNAVSVN